MKLKLKLVLGLLVSGCAADTFGRMTVRPGGAVRNAEACYTSAGSSSMDRCALCACDPLYPPRPAPWSQHMHHALDSAHVPATQAAGSAAGDDHQRYSP